MSYKSIEQALRTLLPSHSDDLPQELVKLAANLLAQSRSSCSTLKAEEEIARPYACAEIACKRLTKSLRLPPPVGCPPCPPRIYKKLYTYIDHALSKASAGTKRQIVDTPTRQQPKRGTASAAATPSKRIPVKGPFSGSTPLRTASGATPRTNGRARAVEAPAWAMPAIRRVCKSLSSRVPGSMSFPPHIYSGLSSILPLIPTLLATAKGNKKAHPYEEFFSPILANDPESKDKTYRGRITTLIVALYFVVLSRADDNKSDRRDADDFVEFSRIALEGEGLEGQEYHDEVNTWLANIVKRGFMEEQEWFKNVPPSTGGEASQNARNRADEDEEDIMTAKKRRMMNGRSTNASRELEAGGLLPGLGTMMSDRLDWLSDERKADFLDWKAGIMERIRIIEGV